MAYQFILGGFFLSRSMVVAIYRHSCSTYIFVIQVIMLSCETVKLLNCAKEGQIFWIYNCNSNFLIFEGKWCQLN